MVDDNPTERSDRPHDDVEDSETDSFQPRVEELRENRETERDTERPESPFGGGGMGDGNPMAQMMGGLMGGGGPGAMAGGPGGSGETNNEELVSELRKIRDEFHDMRRELQRIADALVDS